MIGALTIALCIASVAFSLGTLFGAWWASRDSNHHHDDPDDRYCN